MCGFVAVISSIGQRLDPDSLSRMTDMLAHRGPDDRGLFVEGRVGLGFRRLAILDLAPSGHQPMESADGRYVIVFNGEIYNYLELRAELQALGHRFRSTGDTEVLLAAYCHWGRDCLSKLNGMWAFVIYDRIEQRVFGSRDRFGVKPLFVYQDPRGTVLTSEIKALRDSGYASLDVDEQTIADHLLAGCIDHGERTFYRDVRRVGAGTAFEIDNAGQLREYRYWSLLDAANQLDEPSRPADDYASLFEDAVKLRMRADVPVGVLLSGGLDSTSIICSMARIGAASDPSFDLNAFCYMSPQFDERGYIDATLQQTGARLCRLQDDPADLWADIERHLWFQDEPVHSFTSVLSYQLMGLARSRGVKVLLNGQGADEALAGYPSYFAEYWADLLGQGRWIAVMREFANCGRTLGWPRARQHLSTALQKGVGRLAHRSQRYAAAALQRRVARARRNDWVSPDIRERWRAASTGFADSLPESLRRSFECEPLPLYLRLEDRNSMAHGVEVRLPFMDYRLVSLAFRLPSNWKLRGGLGKFVLRQAMDGRIPSAVRQRVDKFGFPNSADEWFRGPLYEPFRDMLSSRCVRESGLWQVDAVARALEQHRRGERTLGARLFDVAQFSLWMDGSRRWRCDAADRPARASPPAVAA